MGRNKGNLNLAANFQVKIQEALDPRLVVENKVDLINKDTWPSDGDTLYVYEGMVVSVSSEKSLYTLTDISKILNSDYSGWLKIGATDSEISDVSTNAVQNKVVKEYIDLHPQYENVDEIDVPEINLPMVDCDLTLNATSIKPVQNRVITQALDDKVDKVYGKQLSTEDFTKALKTKLEGLKNYDDTDLKNSINNLTTQINTLVRGDASAAIESFNEITAFLNGIEDSENLNSIIAVIEQQIAGKMDDITLAKVATSGSYNDLNDKPTIPSEVTESTVSGWGFTKNTGTYSKPSAGIPKSDLASAVQTSLGKADTALQEHQDISGKQDKLISGTSIKTINGESILGSGDITVVVDTSNLATKTEVNAKQDIIPDLETIRSGAALGATALQEHQDISHLATKEELTNLTNEMVANERVHATAYSDLNTRLNELSENVQGETVTKEEFNTAIEGVNNDISAKQDVLVSGTNIKTINNESILGSGNIELNVDTSSLASKEELQNLQNEVIANEEVHAAAYNDLDSRLKDIGSLISGVAVTKEEFQEGLQAITDEIVANEEVTAAALNELNQRVSDEIPLVDHLSSETVAAISPNIYHRWGEMSSLTLTLIDPTKPTIYNEYMVEFKSGATATNLALPTGLSYFNGDAPTIEANSTYQISIVNGLCIIAKFV